MPGDRKPDADEVVARVLGRLRSRPYTADLDVDERRVRRFVEQHYLSVEPWPVRALTG